MANGEVFNQNYSKYYDLFYADKNYKEEVDYINRLIRAHAPSARTILEYGSGTGGHGLLLKSLGYEILGIERSEEMASVAASNGLNCKVSDIKDFDLPDKFDVCIALFHVISYINDNDSLIKVFQNTKKHLHAGGLFIFDVWFTPAVMNQMPEVRVKRKTSGDVQVMRIAEPQINFIANTIDVNYHIVLKDNASGNYSEFDESHCMRHFGIPEIKLIAEQTGFSFVKAEEFLTGAEPTSNSWGVNFILKSNG